MLKIFFLVLLFCLKNIIAINDKLLDFSDSSSICSIDSKYWEIVNWIYGQKSDISLIVVNENSNELLYQFIDQLFSSN